MKDNVVLLHGAGRSRRAMGCMAKAFTREGYQVHNLGYPSRQAPIQLLADYVSAQIHELQLDPQMKIHFVTHSLGGIVLRYLLKLTKPINLGRVVMLAPPNQGAKLADIFERLPFYNRILGPAGMQIGTRPNSIPNYLGAVDYEVGIIAGNRSFNPLLSVLIPGADDGRIAVESTKLAGMADFLVLPCIHPLIMNYKEVIRQSIHFLAHGCFDRAIGDEHLSHAQSFKMEDVGGESHEHANVLDALVTPILHSRLCVIIPPQICIPAQFLI